MEVCNNEHFFLLLALLSMISVSTQSKGIYNYYVIPSNASSSDCPKGGNGCHTLSYYARTPYFLRESTFVLLNGEHILDTVFAFEGFYSLTFQGANTIHWSEGPHKSTMQSPVIIRCINDSITSFNIMTAHM